MPCCFCLKISPVSLGHFCHLVTFNSIKSAPTSPVQRTAWNCSTILLHTLLFYKSVHILQHCHAEARSAKPRKLFLRNILLGTRGAVLHHSAETVLCFRNQVVLLSCLVALSKYQSLERKPAYGVERAPCAFHNHFCLQFWPYLPF